MRLAPTLAAAAALPLLVAACATTSATPDGPAPETPQPVSLRLDLAGRTAIVLDEAGTGQIEFLRQGDETPVAAPFRNGGFAEAELMPGSYRVVRIGQLLCRGLAFEVDPAASARALGVFRANIVETEYFVALARVQPAPAGDIAELAGRAGAEPAEVDAAPLGQTEAAPCFVNRNGPDMTWEEVPLSQKIMMGVLMAGICAGSVAAGGFCAFGAGLIGF